MTDPIAEQELIDLTGLLLHFSHALKYAVSTLTGLDMMESPEETMHKSVKGPKLSGIAILNGSMNLLSSITMPREAAFTFFYLMTGINREELSDKDLCDGMAELVNVVSGMAKPLLTEFKSRLSMTPPFAIIGDNYEIIHGEKILRASREFYCENINLRLEISYLGGTKK
ncbi:MAG: chemotaxis protein CheX [Bacillota bacterium]